MIKPENIEKSKWQLFLEDIELGLEPGESALINKIDLKDLDKNQKIEIKRSCAIFKKKLLENIARDNSPKLSYDFYKLVKSLEADKELKKFKDSVYKNILEHCLDFLKRSNNESLFYELTEYLALHYSEAVEFRNSN